MEALRSWLAVVVDRCNENIHGICLEQPGFHLGQCSGSWYRLTHEELLFSYSARSKRPNSSTVFPWDIPQPKGILSVGDRCSQGQPRVTSSLGPDVVALCVLQEELHPGFSWTLGGRRWGDHSIMKAICSLFIAPLF